MNCSSPWSGNVHRNWNYVCSAIQLQVLVEEDEHFCILRHEARSQSQNEYAGGWEQLPECHHVHTHVHVRHLHVSDLISCLTCSYTCRRTSTGKAKDTSDGSSTESTTKGCLCVCAVYCLRHRFLNRGQSEFRRLMDRAPSWAIWRRSGRRPRRMGSFQRRKDTSRFGVSAWWAADSIVVQCLSRMSSVFVSAGLTIDLSLRTADDTGHHKAARRSNIVDAVERLRCTAKRASMACSDPHLCLPLHQLAGGQRAMQKVPHQATGAPDGLEAGMTRHLVDAHPLLDDQVVAAQPMSVQPLTWSDSLILEPPSCRTLMTSSAIPTMQSSVSGDRHCTAAYASPSYGQSRRSASRDASLSKCNFPSLSGTRRWIRWSMRRY